MMFGNITPPLEEPTASLRIYSLICWELSLSMILTHHRMCVHLSA